MAVQAPSPSPRVRIATAVKPGVLRRRRSAWRRSCQIAFIDRLLVAPGWSPGARAEPLDGETAPRVGRGLTPSDCYRGNAGPRDSLSRLEGDELGEIAVRGAKGEGRR